MNIQAVFFDMGGTIETFSHTRQMRLDATPGIQTFLRESGIDFPLTIEKLYEVISDGLNRYKRWSIQTMIELPPRRVWCEYVFPDLDIDMDRLAGIAENLMVKVENSFHTRAMRPEIPAVLETIRSMGLKIGLISNINSRGLVPLNLKSYGILHYFDPIVLSSEYGRRKPDPAIFHYAARLAGVPTSACVYVGDRILRDIDGAQRAGFAKAVQIKHHDQHGENDQGAVPDAVIESMAELPEILRSGINSFSITSLPGKVRALIFDAGDILYFRPERGSKFSAFLQGLGLTTLPNHDIKKKAIEYKAYRGLLTHDEYRQEILQMYHIDEPDTVARGKQALIDDDDNVLFFPGVPETLLKLKRQGFLLAIITDTANPLSAKLSWFERGGFGHVWDSIVSSLEIGTRKPDPKIYEASLAQLGISPEQAAFVGHRAAELSGAQAVGMHTIAFNYDTDACADFYIKQFSELLQLPLIS